MSISVADRKRLWGQSGNRCAICRCELIEPVNRDERAVVSEEAHIIAEEERGPRGDPNFSKEKLNTYENLILLCPRDHTRIDKAEFLSLYTVEELRRIKRQHEEWVSSRLSDPNAAKDLRWIEIVRSFSERAHLATWENWTYGLMSPVPYLSQQISADLSELSKWLFSTIWPSDQPNIKSSFDNFETVLSDYLAFQSVYFESRDNRSDRLFVISRLTKEYWNDGYNPEAYNEEFDAVVVAAEFYVEHLTSSANLICEAVRGSIWPSFRETDGHLIVRSGPYDNFEYYSHRFTYPPDERYPGKAALAGRLKEPARKLFRLAP